MATAIERLLTAFDSSILSRTLAMCNLENLEKAEVSLEKLALRFRVGDAVIGRKAGVS